MKNWEQKLQEVESIKQEMVSEYKQKEVELLALRNRINVSFPGLIPDHVQQPPVRTGRSSYKNLVIEHLPTDQNKRIRGGEVCKLIPDAEKSTIYNIIAKAVKTNEVIDGYRIKDAQTPQDSRPCFIKVKA